MSLEYLTWWLCSPGVACFLFLNVLVAAIAVTSSRSRAARQGGRAATMTTTRRLCRSASSMVLDRLRSFSTHPSVELCCCYYYVSPEAEEREVAHDRQSAVPEEPAAMAPAISTMSENAEGEITAAGVARSTSSDGDETLQESMPSSQPPPPAAAAPAHVAVVTAETAARAALVVRGPPKEEPVATVTVTESLKRRHCAPVDAFEGKAELNARAEQFIRQFRLELQLQRLDSMPKMLRWRHTHTLSTS